MQELERQKFREDTITMITSLRRRLLVIIFVIVTGVGIFIWDRYNYRVSGWSLPNHFIAFKDDLKHEHPSIDVLDIRSMNSFLQVEDKCIASPSSIEELPMVIQQWQQYSDSRTCRKYYNIFSSIYSLRQKTTRLKISKSFMLKVKKWLKNDQHLIKETKKQSLLFIDNQYTKESVVFNPVRAKRPGASGGDAQAFVNELVYNSSKNCDFCSYQKFAGQDEFGIMETKSSAIVSNAFKIEKYHGMGLFKNHNPLKFTIEEYLDLINLIGKWFKKVHSLVPDHLYRHMYRDVFPKSSASQVHPHIHLTLANEMYYMKWERLHVAAHEYSFENSGKNYWAELIKVHLALNLGIVHEDAVAIAYLTPQKDYEVMVISSNPSVNFFQLVFCIVRAFFDDLKLFAVSMGYVFPKLDTSPKQASQELPVIVRILSRGPIDSTRSDVSSFDLFGTPNVNKDPFTVIPVIRKSVERRCAKKITMDQWEWE